MKPPTKRLAQAESIAEVAALVDEAIALAKTARKEQDLELLRHAVETRRRLERRGGQLLGKRAHVDIDKDQAARWREAADPTDAVFEASLRRSLARQAVGASASNCWRIRMRLTPWFLDRDGTLTRVLTAVDSSAAE